MLDHWAEAIELEGIKARVAEPERAAQAAKEMKAAEPAITIIDL
jgi:hypothetical protein